MPTARVFSRAHFIYLCRRLSRHHLPHFLFTIDDDTTGVSAGREIQHRGRSFSRRLSRRGADIATPLPGGRQAMGALIYGVTKGTPALLLRRASTDAPSASLLVIATSPRCLRPSSITHASKAFITSMPISSDDAPDAPASSYCKLKAAS